MLNVQKLANDISEVLKAHGLQSVPHPSVVKGPLAGAEVAIVDHVAVVHSYKIQTDEMLTSIQAFCRNDARVNRENPNG